MVPSGGRDQQSSPGDPPRQSPADLAQSFFSGDTDTETPAAAAGNPLGHLFAAIDSVSDSAMTYFTVTCSRLSRRREPCFRPR